MALGIDDVAVGTWTHPQGHTGTTVVLPPSGTVGACAVRGGAPGTRESDALGPRGAIAECHAVVLSGGSAFGLATADGVTAWCEAQGVGVDVGTVRVPIVGAAIVFDIVSSSAPRPDRDAGWSACQAASTGEAATGRHGVGAGCTAAKLAGMAHAVRAGQGAAVERAGELVVGALIAVNPVGEVVADDGTVLAGTSAPPEVPRYPFSAASAPGPGAATVIGCIATNAQLTKTAAHRVADLAHHGIARAVRPSHTGLDGDALFCLATGRVPAATDLVAHLATEAVARAIRAAVGHVA